MGTPRGAAQCENPGGGSVLGVLGDIQTKLNTIQNTLGGAAPTAGERTATTRKGIDVVLGSQWGDEGRASWWICFPRNTMFAPVSLEGPMPDTPSLWTVKSISSTYSHQAFSTRRPCASLVMALLSTSPPFLKRWMD